MIMKDGKSEVQVPAHPGYTEVLLPGLHTAVFLYAQQIVKREGGSKLSCVYSQMGPNPSMRAPFS